jgi:hypothetical protein
MKSLTRKLTIGLLTAALTTYSARVILAGPPMLGKLNGGFAKKVTDAQNNQPNILAIGKLNAGFVKKVVDAQNNQPNTLPVGKLDGGFVKKVIDNQPKALPIGKLDPGFVKKVIDANNQNNQANPDPDWHQYVPHPWSVIRPIIVEGASTSYYEPDATNPVPEAYIRLVNSQKNRVTLKFRLNDGELQSLPAGYSVEIRQAAVISFDRGGAAGRTRYSLTDGTFKFVASGGMWDLVRESLQDEETSLTSYEDANPLPGN